MVPKNQPAISISGHVTKAFYSAPVVQLWIVLKRANVQPKPTFQNVIAFLKWKMRYQKWSLAHFAVSGSGEFLSQYLWLKACCCCTSWYHISYQFMVFQAKELHHPKGVEFVHPNFSMFSAYVSIGVKHSSFQHRPKPMEIGKSSLGKTTNLAPYLIYTRED